MALVLQVIASPTRAPLESIFQWCGRPGGRPFPSQMKDVNKDVTRILNDRRPSDDNDHHKQRPMFEGVKMTEDKIKERDRLWDEFIEENNRLAQIKKEKRLKEFQPDLNLICLKTDLQ